jgi:hypothetical protein
MADVVVAPGCAIALTFIDLGSSTGIFMEGIRGNGKFGLSPGRVIAIRL